MTIIRLTRTSSNPIDSLLSYLSCWCSIFLWISERIEGVRLPLCICIEWTERIWRKRILKSQYTNNKKQIARCKLYSYIIGFCREGSTEWIIGTEGICVTFKWIYNKVHIICANHSETLTIFEWIILKSMWIVRIFLTKRIITESVLVKKETL